ncbi:MAG: AbrB family transcriptional regulator [Hyphomicrobiales bacterium]|nr:AbrB family transcriptional regulator [Hyphomicrobiales bacterium]
MRFVNLNNATSLSADACNLAATLGIAAFAAWLAREIHLPAPYLMGSLLGVWLSGGLIAPLRPRLSVPKWVFFPLILGLGVFFGSNFSADMFSQLSRWSVTIALMILITIFSGCIGFFFLYTVRGYDKITALLSALPGGQVEAMTLAREFTPKAYVVALFHLIRNSAIFISTPLLLVALSGPETLNQADASLARLPSIADMSLTQLTAFVAVAGIGYIIARRIHIPMPHLFGPLILSTTLHFAGWIDIPRAHEFVIFAQLAIGAYVGSNLAQVQISELKGYVVDALTVSILFPILIYSILTAALAHVTGLDMLTLWLAFIPGGIYEVTLLGLIFGYDIAFITAHHIVRLLFIFSVIPAIAARFRVGEKHSPDPPNSDSN